VFAGCSKAEFLGTGLPTAELAGVGPGLLIAVELTDVGPGLPTAELADVGEAALATLCLGVKCFLQAPETRDTRKALNPWFTMVYITGFPQAPRKYKYLSFSSHTSILSSPSTAETWNRTTVGAHMTQKRPVTAVVVIRALCWEFFC